MFRILYNFIITTKLQNLNLFSYLSVAEKYGKIHEDPEEVFDKNGNLLDGEVVKTEPVFISVKGDGGCESCAVFYDNLFILFSMDKEQDDRAVQIYIKRPDDEWQISTNESNSGLNPLNPTNVKVEVYINYDVSVFKLNRRLTCCVGENYTSGKWNKKFYRTLKSFLKKVRGYTELNQVSEAYGK